MSLDDDLAAERLSRVHEWRADVLSHAEAFSSSFKPLLKTSNVEDLFEILRKAHRRDRDTCLQGIRRLINAILLSPESSSKRAELLEKCWDLTKDVYRDTPDLNPFASLLFEPLESIGIPAIVYEICRLSSESHQALEHGLSYGESSGMPRIRVIRTPPQDEAADFDRLLVLRFIITHWEGTLIPSSDVESGDLIKAVRRACLCLGNIDHGNNVFQRVRPLLSSRLNSYIRPSFNSVYSVDVFPNILDGDVSSPSRRKGILASDGVGFTAFIDIPRFRETLAQIRSQSKRSQQSPSSSGPSPSSPFPPTPNLTESINIEFLAAHCAWSLEVGRNSLRLTLLDSDGSSGGDSFVVDAVVEIDLHKTPQCFDQKYVVRFPKSKFCFPSHPRTGGNSTYLPLCFSEHSPSLIAGRNHGSDERSPVTSDIYGFDDERFTDGGSGHLLLKLLVKFDAPSQHMMALQSSLVSPRQYKFPHSHAGNAGSAGRGEIELLRPNDTHRRSISLPLVMVSEPEVNHEVAQEALPSNVSLLPEVASTNSPRKSSRALPKPPVFGASTALGTFDIYADGSNSQPRSGHSKQKSLPDIGRTFVNTSESPSLSLDRDQASASLHSILHQSNALTPKRRPLPRQPSLTIDTVNLRPKSPTASQRLSPRSEGPSISPIEPQSIKAGELKTATATPRNMVHNQRHLYDRPNTPSSIGLLHPDSHTLVAVNGQLRTSLRPLTPASDVKDEEEIPSLAGGSDKNWRRSMFSEMEDYFRVHLPMDHLFNWQGLDEDFVIYPFAIRYLAQYLHWWEHESRKPSAKSLSPHSLLTEVRKLSSTKLLQAIGNQAMVREYLVGILRRTEQFSYRYYSNIEINRSWSNILRRSMQLDEQDMALSLSTALEHDFEWSIQEVIGMQLTDLHNFMDVLQSLIDRQYGSIRVLERFLQKLVDKTGVLPKYLFLSGIKRIGENPIAGGGFADVWKGKSGERTVALKVIRIFGLANPNESQHQEFCKEAMIWRQFRHQNILPFYGVCIDEFSPRLALVSPWMRNGDILSYLKDNDGVNHIALIAGIALGLLYLHTLKPLVIHGDLRGANVLIDDRGRPKLADFGLARIVDSQASTVAATSFNGKGAVRWQAPELLDSCRFGSDYCRVTPCSDVYAFAVVCLEVFTKEIPFAHLRDIQVVSEVVIRDRRPSRPAADSLAVQCGLSDKIWSLVERCWTAQPWDRPDMQTVVQELTADFP